MYAATTKGEGNAADGRFSTACSRLDPAYPALAGRGTFRPKGYGG